jgi:cellobiose epimerase
MGAMDPSLVTELESALERHVIDPWFPRSLDRQHGGFLCDFDHRWKPSGSQQKLLEFQARHTWFAAMASRFYPADQRLLEAREHGFAYLRGPLWDHELGGWFHRLDRMGKPLENETKHVHGVAYGISAAVAVYEATGGQDAMRLARDAFTWMDHHAYDQEYGGYFGYLTRDGTVIRAEEIQQGGTDTTNTPIGCKDINVHSDLLESFTDLYRIWPDRRVRARLIESIDIVCNRLSSPLGAHHHYCLPDWTPVPHLTRFGYQVQSGFRLVAAARLLGGQESAVQMAHRFVAHALRRGRDDVRGGFYYAGPGLGPFNLQGHDVCSRLKLWWVQVEAMKTLLALHSIAPHEKNYFERFEAQWRYVKNSVFDYRFGGFRTMSLEDLPRWRIKERHARSRKGSDWKDSSHEGRALLYCLSVLKKNDPETG